MGMCLSYSEPGFREDMVMGMCLSYSEPGFRED